MKFAAAPGDESADGSPPKINIVINWFEELKDLVPEDWGYDFLRRKSVQEWLVLPSSTVVTLPFSAL